MLMCNNKEIFKAVESQSILQQVYYNSQIKSHICTSISIL